MKNKRLKVASVTICLILAFIVILMSGFIIANNINYKRTSHDDIMLYDYANNASYNVNLLDNEYYGDKLGENNQYISSLIKDVDMEFKFNLNSTNSFKATTTYQIASKLLVNHNVDISSTNLFTEDKILVNDTIVDDSSKISLDKKVTSDYQYYNDYIKRYKDEYSLSSLDAKIIYIFTVNVTGEYEGKEVNETSTSMITVPLLSQTININKQSENRVNKSLYNEVKLPFIKNILFLVTGLTFFIFGICLLIPLFMAIGMINKQNSFRRTIKKYLRIYDDVIVESSIAVDISNKELIEVTNFNDLLDAEQELHVPIVYTEVDYDKEGWFTITTNNQVWRFIFKNEKKD